MLTIPDVKPFEDRGLDAEIAAKMGATFERGRFLFEYRNEGVLTYRKVRTLDKRWWCEPAGQRLHLWNIDGLRGLGSPIVEPLVLTEGEFDACAVAQACGGYVASVPNGANGHRSEGEIFPDKDDGFKFLWGENNKLIPEIDQFDKIILATDSDEKGLLLRDELAIRIGDSRCWFVVYPDGCKDANDVLKQYGPEALQKVIANARPMRPGYLVRPYDLPPKRNEHRYSSGWEGLDKHLMLVRPELVIVSGIPGHGKSQWVRALTFRLAKAHGFRCAYLTPEDPPHRLRRDMERFSRREHMELWCNQWEDKSKPEVQKAAMEWVNAHFWISTPPEDEPITIDVLEAEMTSAALHHGCQVFVLDPWNEISHKRGRRSDTEYIEEQLVRLKRKMRRLGLILIIVAHPRKQEQEKRPNMYDINGSACWFSKADHGIIIHRMEKSTNVEVIIEKCKDWETMGSPGEVWMEFIREKADYEIVT